MPAVLSMDEIVNAVCLHTADRKGVNVRDVQVELSRHDDTGFIAEAWTQGRSQYLVVSNIVEAVLRYLHTEYNIRAYPEDVRLELEDEIIAVVND